MADEIPPDDETYALLPAPTREKREIVVPEDSDEDLEVARKNLLKLAVVTDQAVDEMGDLAFTAQSARGYEVLGQLIEKGLAANREIIDAAKRRKEIKGGPTSPQTINNTLVLTSAEALDLVKKRLKDDGAV